MSSAARERSSALAVQYREGMALAGQSTEILKGKEKAFFDLAECFRQSEDPDKIKRLGQELGKFVFGE